MEANSIAASGCSAVARAANIAAFVHSAAGVQGSSAAASAVGRSASSATGYFQKV